jgi:outer membrane protein assembly factor BamB
MWLGLTLFALLQDPPAPSWPAWRGPDGTNVSSEHEWRSEGAEDRLGNVEPLWRAQVGRGHSCVTLADGALYTQGFDEARELDRIVCLDALTGSERWRYEYPAELDADSHGGGTHATPVVAGGVVYSFERQGILRALDAHSGALRWERDLCADHGAKATDYGFGSSAVVAGELVLVNAAKVVALERASGKTRWVSDDLGAYYSTPALCRIGGVESVASFTRPGLYVLALADGAVRHHFPFKKGETSVSASTPVLVKDSVEVKDPALAKDPALTKGSAHADDTALFISAGYGHGAALVDFASGKPVARWETKAMRTQMSGCVLVGEGFYGFDETVLKCLDRTGKERWRTRGLGMGALTAAGGRLIVLSGNGELVIVEATSEEYRELARRRVLIGSSFWTPPVLCGGLIYARSGEGELVCLDHRAPAGER